MGRGCTPANASVDAGFCGPEGAGAPRWHVFSESGAKRDCRADEALSTGFSRRVWRQTRRRHAAEARITARVCPRICPISNPRSSAFIRVPLFILSGANTLQYL